MIESINGKVKKLSKSFGKLNKKTYCRTNNTKMDNHEFKKIYLSQF